MEDYKCLVRIIEAGSAEKGKAVLGGEVDLTCSVRDTSSTKLEEGISIAGISARQHKLNEVFKQYSK